MSAKKTSLVTSCPACTVSFYITPEQLSAHRGEVRCGKCSHVFNALDRLSELSTTPQTKTAATEAISQVPLEQPEEIIEPAAPGVSVTGSALATPNIADFSIRSASAAASANPLVADVTFKTKLGRPGKRKSPVWSLVLLTLLFALLTTAQAAYYMRTQIAAQWPVLKPYLVDTCKFLNCTVGLPKQINLLSIDDSDLQEDAERQGLIHLSSTIINNATIAQAYPLLELTLTDNYDKPVLRHAFTPHEYLPAGTDISKGLAAGEEVHLKLNITTSGEPVAGYRVFVTYP